MHLWIKTGRPWIWQTAVAVSLSIISVVGLVLLISWHGLSHFWPHAVYQWQLVDAQNRPVTLIGELKDSDTVSDAYLRESGLDLPPDTAPFLDRFLIKTGNREFVPLDFRWILGRDIREKTQPKDVVRIERRSHGYFYGYPTRLLEHGQEIAYQDLQAELGQRLARARDLHDAYVSLQKHEVGQINYQLEKLRLKETKAKLEQRWTPEMSQSLQQQRIVFEKQYQGYIQQMNALTEQSRRDQIVIRDMRGVEVTLELSNLIDVIWPNAMTTFDKVRYWGYQIVRFVIDEPREANTEGGVFPAIFGTIMMVLIMSIIVTPLGVIAAIYLHEYAGKNTLTRLTRIAVINLAGVPSIVYGVFGLGFFVYFLGGSIDQLFYPESLPSPTFGTPGILWSSLTLAILTVPVVIVSTEEGLSRIPTSLRHGSLALGATKAETLFRIILPMSSPAIMTGLILAVARAAGEVAPLMLVGVVKLAPSLPVDGIFPFLHLERKFMHLGFQIYDVGFQSPNVEAARPLVYATSLLLILVIITLNLTAIAIRNHLREKYRTLEH